MTAPVDVLVVGAGPTGLVLALQAHANGARVRIVERRSAAFRPSRALIVHPRTVEGLRPLGIVEPLLAKADVAPEVDLHLAARVIRVRLGELDLSDTAFPHLTLVRQQDVESVLTRALADRDVDVERGAELVSVEDGLDGTRATLPSQSATFTLDCTFVAGCDGPDSTVRRIAGIGWEGGPYHEEVVFADLELDDARIADAAHVLVGRHGVMLMFALGEQATWRMLGTRRGCDLDSPFGQAGPPLAQDELQRLADDAGLAVRISRVGWSARLRLQHRLADRFR